MAWVCRVEGCGALLTEGVYCRRCADEIHALRAIYRLRRMRRNDPAARRFRLLCRRVAKWLWVPEWIFIGAGCAYFVFEFFVGGAQ